MNRIFAAAFFIVAVTCYGQTKHETVKHVILPNPKLLRCQSSDCAQLWLDKSPDATDIYPKQLIVDLAQSIFRSTSD